MLGAWDVSLWIHSGLTEQGQPYHLLLRLTFTGRGSGFYRTAYSSCKKQASFLVCVRPKTCLFFQRT